MSRAILDAGILQRIRRQAMRRRIWFKTLEPKERALVNATILCKARVRSPVLVALLERIVKSKLLRTLSNPSIARFWSLGWRLAHQASRAAVAWGYTDAEQWEHDPCFAKFLAINHRVR